MASKWNTHVIASVAPCQCCLCPKVWWWGGGGCKNEHENEVGEAIVLACVRSGHWGPSSLPELTAWPMFTITRVRGQNLHGHSFNCNSSTAQCSARAAQHSVQIRAAQQCSDKSSTAQCSEKSSTAQCTAESSIRFSLEQYSTVFSKKQHSTVSSQE